MGAWIQECGERMREVGGVWLESRDAKGCVESRCMRMACKAGCMAGVVSKGSNAYCLPHVPLRDLGLDGNQLTSLPAGVFDKLTSLT